MNERVGMFMCMLTVRGIRVDSPLPSHPFQKNEIFVYH